jgi:methylenetetrahydrofolate dehydrogenase (NADP+)/methenyltetrahydrofolate cyclohydrolase
VNVGKLLIGERDGFAPCTPAGVLYMLQAHQVPMAGAECVIVGRSNIVGKPMAALMVQPGVDATVTVCHSRTRELADHTRRADILIVAAGRAEMIDGDMIKPGAVVIDVGMNRIPDATKKSGTRLVGDVAFGSAREVASLITPVPGGVGKMTIAMLMANTVRAAAQLEHAEQAVS